VKKRPLGRGRKKGGFLSGYLGAKEIFCSTKKRETRPPAKKEGRERKGSSLL